MIYADFENILVPEENGNQNPDLFYTNKYQNHVPCSYRYKLVCVNDKPSKPFKSYLGEDTVQQFITRMVKESIYCNRVIKKHFNGDVKVRDHCHITLPYYINLLEP